MNWERHLQSRISDVWKSYVMLLFYYDMGTPDDEWSIAREQGGISYFPHFEKRHHDIKAQIDFYTDVFYYKIFSAWDTVGQLLCLIFPLTLEANERHMVSHTMPAAHFIMLHAMKTHNDYFELGLDDELEVRGEDFKASWTNTTKGE